MIRKYLVYSFVSFIAIYVAMTSFLSLRSVTVLEVHNEPIPILNEDKVVVRGETIDTVVDFCKIGNHKAVTRGFLVSLRTIENIGTIENRYIIPQMISSNAQEGCRVAPLTAWIVPTFVREGTYFLELQVEYEIDVFRKEKIIIQSEPFDVTDRR